MLSESDFLPLSDFAFQHWNQRSGPAFADVRPMTEDAARRMWRRTLEMCSAEWADRDASQRFDLRSGHWQTSDVCKWLCSLGPQSDQPVIVCFQPQSAVTVPWSSLCAHWLILLWTGGCAWPPTGDWLLVHDGDQFAFASKN